MKGTIFHPRTLPRKLRGALPYLRYRFTRRPPQPVDSTMLRVSTWWGPVLVHKKSDSITESLIKNGVYDLDLSLAVLRHAKLGMTVLNIGANIGLYALLAARKVGKDGMVFAFEPDPRSFAVLTENARKFGGIIQPQAYAVSDKKGEMEFWLDEKEPGDSSFAQKNTEGARMHRVPVITVDQFLKEKNAAVDLIIMDIQGAEPLAFEGMKEALHRMHPLTILFECSPQYSENMGTSINHIEELLHGAGFHISHLKKNSLPNPDHSWSELIVELKKRKGGYGFCNLLATK